MYCRNCGTAIDDKAVVCMHCGCRPLDGNKYCPNCGAMTTEKQIICLNCKCQLENLETRAQKEVKESKCNMYIAAILAFFLGAIGIHDFYLGYTKNGIIKIILTITGIGAVASEIWAIVDFVNILTGNKADSNGNPLTRNF